MDAHTLPFTTADLVRGAVAAPRGRSWVLGLAVLRPAAWLDGLSDFVVRWMLDLALAQAGRAVMMEGLAERIDNELRSEFMDADGALYDELKGFEAQCRQQVIDLEARWRDLPAPQGGRRARVRTAAERVAQAILATAEAARDLRGAIQAADANVAAIRRAAGIGRSPVAHSAAELEQQLSELSREE